MKYFELTKEEKEIEKAFIEGKLVRVKNFAREKKDAMLAARNTLNKTRNINIRITERVYSKLKAKAIEEGIPYQTLASSVLHKYVSNREDFEKIVGKKPSE